MASQNSVLVLSERPTIGIVPGRTFRLESTPRPRIEDLKVNEIIVENLYLSIDPAMRAWVDDRPSYIPPVKIGEVMRGATLGRVIASKSSKIKEQELVTTWSGWTTFAVLKDSEVEQASALGAASKPTDYLSILGPTSLTAYFGMLRIGEPRAGETVVVSGAAGATGNIAGQIAGLQGARVIGTAGSDEKCRWLVEELGFALALNYKHPEFEKQFQEATSDGIDVYFDNVGGRILDLALSQANDRARFVMCGGVSQYNGSDTYALKNYLNIVPRRIKMQGFIIFDHAAEFPEARRVLGEWVRDGKIKGRETVIKGGLNAAQQALKDLYSGINTGKLIVEVQDA